MYQESPAPHFVPCVSWLPAQGFQGVNYCWGKHGCASWGWTERDDRMARDRWNQNENRSVLVSQHRNQIQNINPTGEWLTDREGGGGSSGMWSAATWGVWSVPGKTTGKQVGIKVCPDQRCAHPRVSASLISFLGMLPVSFCTIMISPRQLAYIDSEKGHLFIHILHSLISLHAAFTLPFHSWVPITNNLELLAKG